MANRSADWFHQAESDLAWARHSASGGHYAHTCFAAQQSCEKALKAVALARGFDRVKSHSLFEIVRSLGINGRIEEIAKRLDLYYISSRYPDAFPSGAPFEFFSLAQAEEAISFAEELLGRIREELVGIDGR